MKTAHGPQVVVIVADGVRPDTLAQAMAGGAVPALATLRTEGAFHTVTTTFPSVTGPGYTPLVMGRYPGPVGLPGLRWYDRGRRTCRLPGHSRSYTGPEMRLMDGDLDPSAPTLYELAPSSVASLNMIGRGLASDERIGGGVGFMLRTAITHFRGNVDGWIAIDEDVAAKVVHRIRRDRPAFVFAALTGIDKASHAEGQAGPAVQQALAIVDRTVATIRADAERAGSWDSMHLWVVSDHGHSPVEQHEDLAGFVRGMGFRTIAHPFVYSLRGEVAVMVSGNAMAHLYVDLERRERPWKSGLAGRWDAIVQALKDRSSVDLLIVPVEPGTCEIHGRGRGWARLEWGDRRLSYTPLNGDPLAIGPHSGIDETAAWEVTRESDYPDALVQLARLSDSPRTGDIIVSGARGWDFRAKYEPIPHRSSHGALHRDHMLVPLLLNRPARAVPHRTVDVMPSALDALGLPHPARLDGVSFLRASSVDDDLPVHPRMLVAVERESAGRREDALVGS